MTQVEQDKTVDAGAAAAGDETNEKDEEEYEENEDEEYEEYANDDDDADNNDNDGQLPEGDSWQKGDEANMSIMRDCFCPACHASRAVTYLLPTKVPFFREIYCMNLTCPDCGFRNAEVHFGGEIQPRGTRLELKVTSPDDMNRQVIKSDSASLLLPDIQLEIPPTTQRGTTSTIEGVLKRTVEQLQAQQPERLRLQDLDNFYRCRTVIRTLRKWVGEAEDDSDNEDEKDDEEKQQQKDTAFVPFLLILDDPAGNSFVENPLAPAPDPHLQTTHYERTPHQDMQLGLQPSQAALDEGTIDDTNPQHKNVVNRQTTQVQVAQPARAAAASKEEEAPSNPASTNMMPSATLGRQEVLEFSTTCPHCTKPVSTDMCVTDIPHFKEIIIMSMNCAACGFRSNEIKGGGGIPEFGNKIIVQITSEKDLAREVLKSDSGGIAIPQIELEMEEGSLDGVYTTVEGLLQKVRERLAQANPFSTGDAAVMQHTANDGGDFSEPAPVHQRYRAFLDKLQEMQDGKRLPFTLILTDPLANSFVGPRADDAIRLSLQAEKEGNHQCYHDYVDEGMVVEEYVRSFEQNEILGLNDIRVENYHSETTATGNDNKEDEPSHYYGTDRPEPLPDRLKRVDIRGPDHPHVVGKAPVEGDTTVMGAGSANFAVPGVAMRGKTQEQQQHAATNATMEADSSQTEEARAQALRMLDEKDAAFVKSDSYSGSRSGMVFRMGAQGLGYYSDRLQSEVSS